MMPKTTPPKTPSPWYTPLLSDEKVQAALEKHPSAQRNWSKLENNGLCFDAAVGLLCEPKLPDQPFVYCDVGEAGHPRVILVLESPHRDEYKLPLVKGHPRPARGTTGRNIRKFLHASLSKVSDERILDEYSLVLMNAVPYPCSLFPLLAAGQSARKSLDTAVRNAAFRSLWATFGEEQFVERLRRLAKPGDMVVNACTKGDQPKGEPMLRELVQQAIDGTFAQAQRPTLVRRTHPASWRNETQAQRGWEISAR